MSEQPEFTMSERYLHPEGTFPLQLVEWESKPGQYGPQIKWTFESNLTRDDGEQARLSWFTSCNFSTDERSKLGVLLKALGASMPATPAEAKTWSPETLIGKSCRGRISWRPGRDGTDWANIEALMPVTARRGAAPSPPPPLEEDFVDPFGRDEEEDETAPEPPTLPTLVTRFGNLKGRAKGLGLKVDALPRDVTAEEVQEQLLILEAAIIDAETKQAETPTEEAAE